MSDVVYRRIRGRIVPIRKKKSGPSLLGPGLIAGGIGASLAGGFVAGKGLKKVVKLTDSAKAAAITAALSFDPSH